MTAVLVDPVADPIESTTPRHTSMTPAVSEQRVSWRVGASGEYAACTVLRPGERPALEVRTTTSRTVHAVPKLGPTSQLLLDDDGSVLLCHHRDSRHFVERVDPDGTITSLAVSTGQGFALIDHTYALEYDRSGFSRLVRFGSGTPIEVARFSGAAVGAVPLGGGRIAVNVMIDGHCSAVAVDTGSGAIEPFVSVSPRSDDQVVDYLAESRLLIIATNASGEVRLGVGRVGEQPVTFPPSLAGPGAATHLATTSDGSTLAVSFEVGSRSEIRIVDARTGMARELELPPLVVLGRGALTRDVLVVPVSTPVHPATLLRVDLASGRCRLDDPAVHGVPTCRLETLSATGGLEAVVIGDPVTAETVLVALHGGPLSAWRAMFDPFLAALASAGIAVVAPNIRGSVGYGRAHASAIIGDWGGPDLADVLAVGAAVTAMRPAGARPPGLLGISYGAYLALLAAQRQPATWSVCAALSPFVSGARLVGEGGPVADLVRRLGGATSPDLREGLAAITAPVLLLYGEQDDVIPAAESALLYSALRALARPCTFRPLPRAGHDLLTGPLGPVVIDEVVAFCQPLPSAIEEHSAAPRSSERVPHKWQPKGGK